MICVAVKDWGRLSSAFPGLVLVYTIGAKDILFLMITINIAFCSFHFHYLVRK